jgi:hypothetical protein
MTVVEELAYEPGQLPGQTARFAPAKPRLRACSARAFGLPGLSDLSAQTEERVCPGYAQAEASIARATSWLPRQWSKPVQSLSPALPARYDEPGKGNTRPRPGPPSPTRTPGGDPPPGVTPLPRVDRRA